jgi:hypothetical protein
MIVKVSTQNKLLQAPTSENRRVSQVLAKMIPCISSFTAVKSENKQTQLTVWKSFLLDGVRTYNWFDIAVDPSQGAHRVD